jgi:membrane protein
VQDVWRVLVDAFDRFNVNEGWALASHIALSALMALFPFLIFVTAVAASLFGSRELADETARILLEAWPEQVADPIAAEIRNVMEGLPGDVLTFAVGLALFFSSSGIESLRIALNRAYGVPEARAWWLLRIESIGYVLVGAAALLALSFLVVLYPLMWATAIRYVKWLATFGYLLDFVRIGAAATRQLRLCVRHLLRGTCLGDGGAGVPVSRRHGVHLWRRAECGAGAGCGQGGAALALSLLWISRR